MFVFYCTVNNSLYVCSFCRDQIFMDFVSFLSMIIYEVLYTWCISDKKLLVDKINGLKYSENANGAICSLQDAGIQTENKIEESVSLFNSYIEVPPIQTDEFFIRSN